MHSEGFSFNSGVLGYRALSQLVILVAANVVSRPPPFAVER